EQKQTRAAEHGAIGEQVEQGSFAAGGARTVRLPTKRGGRGDARPAVMDHEGHESRHQPAEAVVLLAAPPVRLIPRHEAPKSDRHQHGGAKRHGHGGGKFLPVFLHRGCRGGEMGSIAGKAQARASALSPTTPLLAPCPCGVGQASVKTSEQLVPPKPKLLARAARTFFSTATFGVTFRPRAAMAGSSSLRL